MGQEKPPPARVVAGRYELRRLIGRGGFGEVYDGVQTATGRRVAVKLVHPARVDDRDEMLTRFEREVRATAALASPNIVQVLDAGSDPSGAPFMVMEYLQGEDVASLSARLGKLPHGLASRIVAQACLGLEAAHAAGLVHRDIKPANLFLTAAAADDTRTLKVLDFGIARMRGTDPLSDGDGEITDLTASGVILGSPSYMAPEQIRGRRDIDPRADIWSIGVVLFKLLSNRLPFERGDGGLGELFVAICSSPAPDVRSLSPDVSAALAAVVRRALQTSPDDRYPTIRALLDDLLALLPAGPPVIVAFDVAGDTNGAASLRAVSLPRRVSIEPTAGASPSAATLPAPARRSPWSVRPWIVALGVLTTVGGGGAMWALREKAPERPDLPPALAVESQGSAQNAMELPPELARTAGAAWFSRVRGRCNSVEVELLLRSSPPPPGRDGVGFAAACYALAGKVLEARRTIETLPVADRAFAVWAVFEVVHPIADAGDDTSAGPVMRMVLDYWPTNYMALYHAGIAEYAADDTVAAREHLKRFVGIYHKPDGFTQTAQRVLRELDESAPKKAPADCTRSITTDPEGRAIYAKGCRREEASRRPKR